MSNALVFQGRKQTYVKHQLQTNKRRIFCYFLPSLAEENLSSRYNEPTK